MELKKILIFVILLISGSSIIFATNHSEEFIDRGTSSGDSGSYNPEDDPYYQDPNEAENLSAQEEIIRAENEDVNNGNLNQDNNNDIENTQNQEVLGNNENTQNNIQTIEKLEQDFELMKENQSQTQTTLNYLIIILIVMFLFFISVFSFILMKNKN